MIPHIRRLLPLATFLALITCSHGRRINKFWKETDQLWIPLGSFCFLPGFGTIEYTISFPDNGFHPALILYYENVEKTLFENAFNEEEQTEYNINTLDRNQGRSSSTDGGNKATINATMAAAAIVDEDAYMEVSVLKQFYYLRTLCWAIIF